MEFGPTLTETALLLSSLLLIISVLASKASSRLGVPALLLFLVVGMLAGSEGPGGIYFDNAQAAQSLGIVALALILYAGGLDTSWSSVRPVLLPGLTLATFGVMITALLLGWFASIILDFSLTEGLLLGAIVSSTDAAAVFAVLRSRNVGLKGNLAPLLELESGSNDPMAVFLTLGFIRLLVDESASLVDLVPMFIRQMLLGVVLGYMLSRLMIFVINRIRLEYEGLYTVLSLSLVIFTYSATSYIGGNGFLATYVAGIIVGNSGFIHKRSLVRFHDGLAWLMQIAMFLTLGLLVFPSRIIPVMGAGVLVAAFLILVARPVSVYTTLIFSKMDLREKTLVAWVGLRGAVPIILATFPLLAGVEKADMIFNVIFFVVITSAIIQGSTIPIVAKWLKVDAPVPVSPGYVFGLPPTETVRSRLSDVDVPADSPVVGKQIVEAGFPDGVLVLLIKRHGEWLTPTGATVLQPGDIITVLADEESRAELNAVFGIS